MYLVHFTLSTVDQNSLITYISCCLVVGLTSLRTNSLSSCQRFSIGLRSGDSGTVFHQFMPLSSKKLSQNRTMFRVIILHKLVAVREFVTDKGEQANSKDFNIQWGIHCTLKDYYISRSFQTNACPHMYFDGMLSPTKTNVIDEKNKHGMALMICFETIYQNLAIKIYLQ